MNDKHLASSFLKTAAIIGLGGILAVFVTAYLDAADCPAGQVAVRNIWNWPVCIGGGQ